MRHRRRVSEFVFDRAESPKRARRVHCPWASRTAARRIGAPRSAEFAPRRVQHPFPFVSGMQICSRVSHRDTSGTESLPGPRLRSSSPRSGSFSGSIQASAARGSSAAARQRAQLSCVYGAAERVRSVRVGPRPVLVLFAFLCLFRSAGRDKGRGGERDARRGIIRAD